MNNQVCEEKYQNLSNYDDIITISVNYTDSQEIWKDLKTEDYFKIFAYIVMIVGGLLGNISVILSVILIKTLRTTINFYVANLAVADVMICIICMIPHALTVATTDVDIFATFTCKYSHFTQKTCLISSVLTLSVISLNRFLVVVFPTRMMRVKQRTSLVISLIWFISVAVSTPLLFFKRVVYIEFPNYLMKECAEIWPVSWYYDETTAKCVTHTPLRVAYYFVICTTLYFLPVIIMIPAYSFIVWTVQTRPRVRQTSPGEQTISLETQSEIKEDVHSRTSRKVNHMVFFILVAFIICWTPFQVILVFAAVQSYWGIPIPDWLADIKWVSYFLAYGNSFINPIIYGIYNKKFRDGFCGILRCGFPGRRFGGLVRSIRTFTTRLTSSRTRRTSEISNKDGNISHKCNIELKIIQPETNEVISPTARDTIVEIAGTEDKDYL